MMSCLGHCDAPIPNVPCSMALSVEVRMASVPGGSVPAAPEPVSGGGGGGSGRGRRGGGSGPGTLPPPFMEHPPLPHPSPSLRVGAQLNAPRGWGLQASPSSGTCRGAVAARGTQHGKGRGPCTAPLHNAAHTRDARRTGNTRGRHGGLWIWRRTTKKWRSGWMASRH